MHFLPKIDSLELDHGLDWGNYPLAPDHRLDWEKKWRPDSCLLLSVSSGPFRLGFEDTFIETWNGFEDTF